MKNTQRMKIIYRTKTDKQKIFVLGLLTVFEGFVQVFSLGNLSSDARAWYLFDYLED